MATVIEIMDAIASTIEDGLCGTAAPLIPELQVDGRLIANPTPPAVDVYPADPFTERIAYGRGQRSLRFTIRARVSTADQEAGQDLLLSMMDPAATTSLSGVLENDENLGGLVAGMAITGPSGMGWFTPPVTENSEGSLLGCTWTAEVTP